MKKIKVALAVQQVKFKSILLSKHSRSATMTGVLLDIKQWGNNLGVRLPAAIVREAGLHVHQRVLLTVIDGQVIIKPAPQESLTLEQRLAQFDVSKHSGEVMTVQHNLGAEQW